MNQEQLKKVKLKVHGTHCTACEVLIERKFRCIPGVVGTKVSYASGKAVVYCSSRIPDVSEFNEAVRADGYSVVDPGDASAVQGQRNGAREYAEIAGLVAIIIGVYFFLRQFNLIPSGFGVTDAMSYGFVFVLGLVAAVSTCIAVTGGLLVAVASRYAEAHPEQSGLQKIRPHIYFNAGRIVSYTVLGGIVGALGSFIALSPSATGIITIIASTVMVVLGLQMLHLFPLLRRLQFRMPKFLAHRIHDASGAEHRFAPFLLGASTFFLPCGFTQALQLYVLSQGDWISGALTMLVFSLGTLPALASLSVLTSFARGAFRRHFVRFAGVVVIVLGLFNIDNGFAVAGIPVSPRVLFDALKPSREVAGANVTNVGGVQVAEMRVDGLEYYPHQFTVEKGRPVEWRIDGTKASGCAQILVSKKLGLTRRLPRDRVDIIRFTPDEADTIEFSCAMGMTTPGSRFLVLADDTSAAAVVPSQGPAAGQNNRDCDPSTAMCLWQLKELGL